jgi:hypothetical protein
MLYRAILVLLHATAALSHGFLAQPKARNLLDGNDCPHCLNGPGRCGGTSGRYERPGRITGTYRAGRTMKARMVITANHQGRWSLELCGTNNKRCSTIRLARGKGVHTYIRAGDRASSAVFRVPRARGVHTLRWVWETGNSCNPVGTPPRFANRDLEPCGKWIDAEKFVNCADIRIK